MTKVTIQTGGNSVSCTPDTLPAGTFFYYFHNLHMVVEWGEETATVWNFSISRMQTFIWSDKAQYFPQSYVDITAKQ